MKRLGQLIAFILVSSVFFQSAYAQDGIKAVFDDYAYAMTVEWDQRDQNFAHEQAVKLQQNIIKLLESGHSPTEILNELSRYAPGIDFNDPEAIAQFTQSTMNENYQRGASWYGRSIPSEFWVLTAIFSAGIVTLLVKNSKSDTSNK